MECNDIPILHAINWYIVPNVVVVDGDGDTSFSWYRLTGCLHC